jgi:hypothetical protein
LYEYQNKGLTRSAFRKLLILRDAILVVLGSSTTGNDGLLYRKAGAISRTLYGVIYKINYTTGLGKVKKKLGCRVSLNLPTIVTTKKIQTDPLAEKLRQERMQGRARQKLGT